MKTWEKDKDELLHATEWRRVIRRAGNFTYLYFFFILEYDNQTFILNSRTHKCSSIEGVSHHIIPLLPYIDRMAFVRNEKVIFQTYMEYICIDNVIIDADFNQTFIRTKYSTDIKVIDSIDTYIAVEDFRGIHILKWHPTNERKPLMELPYYYKDIESRPFGGLFMSDYYGIFSPIKYFDPVEKVFKADVEKIKEDYIESNKMFVQECRFGEHYTLMDGLDGDPDAYWNID